MSLQTFNQGPMIDVIGLVSALASDVANTRSVRGLPPLVCNTQSPVYPFYLGQESIRQETAPPRIVFVPTSIETKPAWTARSFITGNQTGQVQGIPARPFSSRGSTSTPTCGATRTRWQRTIYCRSITLSSFTESCLDRATECSAARRIYASVAANVINRPTTTVTVVCSCSISESASTSPTSLITSCRSRILQLRERPSMFPSRHKRTSRTVRQRSSDRSYSRSEA